MATVMRNFFVLASFCLLSSLFVSCNKNVVFSEYTKIPEEGWKTENKLTYTVDIADNKPYHNVFLTVLQCFSNGASMFFFNTVLIVIKTRKLIINKIDRYFINEETCFNQARIYSWLDVPAVAVGK